MIDVGSGTDTAPPAEAAWTIQRVLVSSTGWLAARGVTDTARLDAEILLAEALGLRRIDLYVHFDKPLAPAERDLFRGYLRRRGDGEPVAYVTGRKDFFGRTYAVTRDVLIPRPDTEVLVETALAAVTAREPSAPLAILDVGTGSGCVAVALAERLPGATVTAWDVSAPALAVACRNVETADLGARVSCELRDALAPDAWDGVGPFDLVVSNPPYIPPAAAAGLARSVRDFEPAAALFAAPDGLGFYRRLAAAAPTALVPGGVLAVEVGADQAAAVTALFAAAGLEDVRVAKDYARLDRVVTARRGAAT